MAFVPRILQRWLHGTVLSGEPTAIPDDALRVSRNVRTDRVPGAISVRPGSLFLAALPGVGTMLAKLYGLAADYAYTQIETTLYRLTDGWGSATSIATAIGTTPATHATMPDGAPTPVPHKYFASDIGPIGKDDGTTLTIWGIAPPTAAIQAVALAADLTTTIDACDAASNWTGAGLTSGPTDDTTMLQEGTGSVTFSIAANTLGTLAQGNLGGGGGQLNLDTLTGGDDTVKADDYIHLWVRLDRPERLEYLQIDVDLDTQTVANAFHTNYYSRVVASTEFAIGADEWNQLQLRKSSFQRYGSGALSWANAKSIRLRILTNTLGTLNVWVDDLKLRGGVGLEGDIEYTVCYRNSATKGRGNPPKNSEGAVLWTTPLTTNRQRITLTMTNVAQGGVNHPGDPQIDKWWLFRRGGTIFTEPVRVTEQDDSTTSYTDAVSDATLLLSPIALDVDNDMPPPASIVFGPGATNRLWMIQNHFRLRWSKPWETEENRAENWPQDNDAGIGDGSQQALAGCVLDTQVVLWDEARSYQVVGRGTGNFVPVVIPGSRGIVGTFAWTAGDGRLFVWSQDGIYEQVGGRQTKLTHDIDPFFEGQSVDGGPALNTDAGALRDVRLQWYPDPMAPMVLALYPSAGSPFCDRQLILKRSLTTGQYTACFFDDRPYPLRAVMLDDEDRALLASSGGGTLGIYQLEDPGGTADAGEAIAIRWRTSSDEHGAPRQQKRYSTVVIEGTTGGTPVEVAAYYDKGTVREALGTLASTSAVTQTLLNTFDATAKRHDIAVEVSGALTAGGTWSKVGWYGSVLGQALTVWDSDIINYPYVMRWQWLYLDLDTQADVTVEVYVHEMLRYTTLLPVAIRAPQRVEIPATLRGKRWRIRLASSASFDVYGITPWGKPYGSSIGYQPLPVGQGAA